MEQVGEWLGWAVKEFSLDTVDITKFECNGRELTELTKDDFIQRAPPNTGDILYSHLNLLRARNCKFVSFLSHHVILPSLSLTLSLSSLVQLLQLLNIRQQEEN